MAVITIAAAVASSYSRPYVGLRLVSTLARDRSLAPTPNMLVVIAVAATIFTAVGAVPPAPPPGKPYYGDPKLGWSVLAPVNAIRACIMGL